MKQLFKNYEIRHTSVQLIFSVTFALSLTMFELIIFEILGVLDSSSRYFHWRLGLTSLLAMVIAVIPLYILYSVIHSISFGEWACCQEAPVAIEFDANELLQFQFPKNGFGL